MTFARYTKLVLHENTVSISPARKLHFSLGLARPADILLKEGPAVSMGLVSDGHRTHRNEGQAAVTAGVTERRFRKRMFAGRHAREASETVFLAKLAL